MGVDYYEDDYYGGDYYDGGGYGGDVFMESDIGYGGGGDWSFDTTYWPTFDEYYGSGGEPIDYDAGSGSDLFYDYFAYYTDLGYSLDDATDLAMQAASELSLPDTTYAPAPTPIEYAPYQPLWPIEEPQYFPLPFLPYEQSAPIEEPQYFPLPVPPPPLPPSPASSQPNLPPACPSGQYHPYPIGHPQQNACVPFPVSSTPQPQPQPRSSGGASSGGSTSAPKQPTQQQPKQPTQQQCPSGYYRDPVTGQCKPIPQGQPQQCPPGYYRASNGQCLPIPRCTTPGTVFDAARGICVPQGQAVAPVSPSGELGDLFGDLKKLPWWVWLAAGGLLLLGKDDDGGKKTTVTYRRAR
jgi:hypothetical protein